MMLTLAQGGAGSYDWAHEFHPFTAFHWVTSGVCLAIMALTSGLCLWWRGTRREFIFRRSWAVCVLVFQVVFVIYYVRPPFDIAYSLPLHICDLAGLFGGLALLTQKRWTRVILYYWGICLSTQAFITPVLHSDFGYADIEYWAFWGLHLVIVGSAVYDLVVLRFRPTWLDFRTAVLGTGAYTAAIFVFNRKLGTNYLYIGPRKPDNPTIIDHLGEYPWRALWLCLIVIAGFAVFTAVWPSAWRRQARPATNPV